jgi:PAS domain S-box-containing protein
MTIECSSKLMTAVLSPDALINFVSANTEPQTGYQPSEILGRAVMDLLEDNSAFELPRILADADKNGYWEGNIVYRTRNGKSCPARGAVTPLTGSETDGYLLVSIPTDTQTQSKNERSKISGIADVLRGCAHDMNNVMAIIMGFAQLLMIDETCSKNVKSDLEKILVELRQLVEIVERMHKYAYSL